MIEILLYGVIGDPGDGLDAKTIRGQITDSTGPIDLRINSGGGYVVEGQAIVAALAEAVAAGREVNVYIDGLAASMASVIAMVGTTINMSDTALMMIHNPWDIAMGDAAALRGAADQLDLVRDQIVKAYQGQTNMSAEDLTAMMDAETWMDSDTALASGFITNIVKTSPNKAKNMAVKPVDVSKFGFNKTPVNAVLTNKPAKAAPVSPTAQANATSKEKNVDPELIKKIMAFAAAHKVSIELQTKALTAVITYDEMVAQHNTAVAEAAAATETGTSTVSAALNTRIMAYVRAHKVSDEIRDQALEGKITFDQMVDKHTEAVAASHESSRITNVRTGETLDASPLEEANLRAMMLTATSLRGLGQKLPAALEPTDRARAYGEQSVRSIAAFVCRTNDVRVTPDMSDRQLISAALSVNPRASSGGVISTGDLGNVLGQPIRAVFDAGYEMQLAEVTYPSYTSQMLVPDFKGVNLINIGMFSGIKKITEGGKLPLARLGDGARFMQLSTDGLKISFTREAIINDEFNALIQAINNLGMIFKQNEDDQAMDALVNGELVEKDENGNWVSNPVFDPEYNSLVNVQALDDDGMAAAREAMRKQRGTGGYRMNITPRVLAVSTDLENQGLKIAGANALGQVIANALANVSTAQAMNLTLIVLDKLPPKTAFLMGAPQFAQIVKILRLQGSPGPQIYSIPVGDRMSLEWGCINDFAAQMVGRVGVVKIVVA